MSQLGVELSRRRMLSAGVGLLAGASAGAMIVASPAGASTGASTVTLWTLNPNWGTPLTTSSGSDTKSRCRSNACRKAAPHRFFLTEADAIAGRLHKCCLAQPAPVKVCIDLNELMPFYKARLGGVDARCPILPAAVKSALVAGVCSVPSTPTTTVVPELPSDRTAGADQSPSGSAGPASKVGGLESARAPGSLAFTGADATGLAIVGGAAVIGGAIIAASSADSLSSSEPSGD